ncbi:MULTISPECIES: hypothetical protein [unclassified Acinetobacter]|uniref:hypothetical protein n=4 Tax=Acinetobacter TaxID=469 RepID=UPI0015D0E59D|nr:MULTISPECIES: hypothetical protein [unclassified Acinetobacter]
MIHKQIGGKNKQRNVKNSLSYLLRKDKIEEQQYIKVLSTTTEKDILNFNEYIQSKNFSHPYTAGVLSFEEKDIDEDLKNKIMSEFEEMMFAEIAPENRPPVLWVQHQDKGRLELNYLTFNALADKRAYKTYYHYADKKLFNAFCEVVNYENNISSVIDVENHKERNKLINTLNNKIPKHKKDIVNKLQEEIIAKISIEEINNRKELIDFLTKEKNIIINRTGDNYISIKFSEEDKPVRLKGDIYEQSRDYKTYNEESRIDHRADREYVKNALREHTSVFDAELSKRTSRNKKRFKRTQNENKNSNEQNNKRTNDIQDVRSEISSNNNSLIRNEFIFLNFNNDFNKENLNNEQNNRSDKTEERTREQRIRSIGSEIENINQEQQSIYSKFEDRSREQQYINEKSKRIRRRIRLSNRYVDRFFRLFFDNIERFKRTQELKKSITQKVSKFFKKQEETQGQQNKIERRRRFKI